jgi:hypothetical protein
MGDRVTHPIRTGSRRLQVRDIPKDYLVAYNLFHLSD